MSINTTDELFGRLRELLPELQARFLVTRLGIYSAYGAKTWEMLYHQGQRLELIVECSEPLGTEFITMQRWVEQQLGRPVHMKSPNMIPGLVRARVMENTRFV